MSYLWRSYLTTTSDPHETLSFHGSVAHCGACLLLCSNRKGVAGVFVNIGTRIRLVPLQPGFSRRALAVFWTCMFCFRRVHIVGMMLHVPCLVTPEKRWNLDRNHTKTFVLAGKPAKSNLVVEDVGLVKHLPSQISLTLLKLPNKQSINTLWYHPSKLNLKKGQHLKFSR